MNFSPADFGEIKSPAEKPTYVGWYVSKISRAAVLIGSACPERMDDEMFCYWNGYRWNAEFQERWWFGLNKIYDCSN